MLEPFETAATGAAAASSAAIPLALPPDGPTQTAIGTRDARIARTSGCGIDVDRAARVELDHEQRRSAVGGSRRIESRISAGVRRIDEPVDLDDVDARLCVARRRVAARRVGRAPRPSTRARYRARARRAPHGRRTRLRTAHRGSRSIGAMELAHFCSTSRVVIVAGKGGVGKTTVTATLAVAAARTGMSVLIVEVEGKSGLATAFDRPALGYEETELADGCGAARSPPTPRCVDWLEGNGLKRISKRLVQTGALDMIATAVPGMKDILVLGKVKSLEQDARRRPHHRRRARRRPRDHLPHLRARTARRGRASVRCASRPPTWSSCCRTRRAARCCS